MKIVVTGSLGNISKPLTKELIQQGHQVTVISSNTDRQQEIETLGAVAAIGSLEDAGFLSTAFAGADAVYAMVPPNFAAEDQIAYYSRIADSYATAIRNAGVKRVVHLSSYGAHRSQGTGFILGSHHSEQILSQLSDVAITFLRPTFFFYNLYGFVDMIKHQGFMGSNYGGEDKLLMVYPTDIAHAAAEELTSIGGGVNVRYVVSDERGCNEVARVLGAAIGKPDLQWQLFTKEQAKAGMERAGLPPHVVDNLADLNESTHNGALREDFDKHPPAVWGKVKLEDFVKELAAAF
ncbi:NAD(P)H-binding protein [Chitinophaga pinensis]|uniref:NmrA family protein n=1 Tax=Chitinophaga pinensis (strain ATCC 43595 / DSM 2588 / LMG 13176 / NBRC 15968 / NCIMB 11800 / UQM 2034) TaxID=485918 RepID=A0A979G948_CHIPD|nr:NAD(P)H-binding protein [Chitinophaga pinensis]ACU63041.1 NmrA family protein [Chitinophaga pinensis DSM 2588]